MSITEVMTLALAHAARRGERVGGFHLTVGAYRQLLRETDPRNIVLERDVLVGQEAMPFMGFPVQIVPGPQNKVTIIVARATEKSSHGGGGEGA